MAHIKQITYNDPKWNNAQICVNFFYRVYENFEICAA